MMADRIDDLMGKHWPELLKQVATGLALGPALEKFLPVGRLTDAKPYRVNSHWSQARTARSSIAQLVDATGQRGLELRRYDPTPEGAYELLVTHRLEVGELKDNYDRVMTDVKLFAQEARRLELRTVLWLLSRAAVTYGRFDNARIKRAVKSLSPPCRLIAPKDDKTAQAAKTQGVVEDHVAPQGALAAGVFAMLLPLATGPSVDRVVDDLTCTWQRTPGTQVDIFVSERFFVNNPDRAARFMS
jgi:hypothetical protein